MITNDFSILICTNGHETTKPALDYGIWLAQLLEKKVMLLGIDEYPKEKKQLDKLLEETANKLSQRKISFEQRMESDHGTEAIARVVNSGTFLTVVSPLGRPVWQRVVQGRSYRRLLAKIETPLLYVPQVCLPLKKMLICVGGLGYATSLEHLSLFIARAAKADVTLLHVVEPINIEYPTAMEIQHHLDNILETDTPQAHNLNQALEEFRTAGLKTEIKVRHGSIVREILYEVHHGDYDLIGLGSPYSTKSLRHFYTANVTAEVAESIPQPVLSARVGQNLIDN